MPFATATALFIFALTGAMTPGPNNVMLLASGANFGFRRSVPHILGIVCGFTLLLCAIGLGLGSLLTAVPELALALKIVGGAYLLWLAWKIASDRSAVGEAHVTRPMSFAEAVLFQWVNPKAWIMSVSAMAVYTDPDAVVVTTGIVILCFVLSGLLSAPSWAAFGTGLRRFLIDPTRRKRFNIAMGVLLALTLIPMLA